MDNLRDIYRQVQIKSDIWAFRVNICKDMKNSLLSYSIHIISLARKCVCFYTIPTETLQTIQNIAKLL